MTDFDHDAYNAKCRAFAVLPRPHPIIRGLGATHPPRAMDGPGRPPADR